MTKKKPKPMSGAHIPNYEKRIRYDTILTTIDQLKCPCHRNKTNKWKFFQISSEELSYIPMVRNNK